MLSRHQEELNKVVKQIELYAQKLGCSVSSFELDPKPEIKFNQEQARVQFISPRFLRELSTLQNKIQLTPAHISNHRSDGTVEVTVHEQKLSLGEVASETLKTGGNVILQEISGYFRTLTEQEFEQQEALDKIQRRNRDIISEAEKYRDNLIRQYQIKVALTDAAKVTESLQTNAWVPVFIVQARMLHERNFFGSQKRNTVTHLQFEEAFERGRIKRKPYQTLCLAKAKFDMSEHLPHTDDNGEKVRGTITCPKCRKMLGLDHEVEVV